MPQLFLMNVAQTIAPSGSGLTFNATLGAVRIATRAGDVHTRQFHISTDAAQPPAQFRAHFEDWWRSADGRESFYAPPGTLRHSCSSWASANPVEATLEPGGVLAIRYTVAVPLDAETGGYWCALTVEQVPDPETRHQGVGVQFLASVSTGIFIDVGEVTRAADITGIDVDSDGAIVTMRNTGNTPLAVEGSVEFRSTRDGTVIARMDVPRSTVLPERVTTGRFAAPLPDADVLPSGRYLVRALMDIGVDHYLGAEREVVVTRGEGIDEAGR
jgi:hypothetical protein